MTEHERQEIIATLGRQADRARTLASLYEEAAATVAGYLTDDEYQALESVR